MEFLPDSVGRMIGSRFLVTGSRWSLTRGGLDLVATRPSSLPFPSVSLFQVQYQYKRASNNSLLSVLSERGERRVGIRFWSEISRRGSGLEDGVTDPLLDGSPLPS